MNNLGDRYTILKRFVNRKVDGLIVYKERRWQLYFAIVLVFLMRMIYYQGYYAIAYFLGFYTVQNAILYMTPSGIPSITDVIYNLGR